MAEHLKKTKAPVYKKGYLPECADVAIFYSLKAKKRAAKHGFCTFCKKAKAVCHKEI